MNKKRFLKISALVIIFILAVYFVITRSDNGYCNYKLIGPGLCNFKKIKITGIVPNDRSVTSIGDVGQHPITEIETNQSYLNTTIGQIVLYSEDKINCQEKMTVIGRLRKNCLGGPAGTKDSYCGYSIQVSKWSCEQIMPKRYMK